MSSDLHSHCWPGHPCLHCKYLIYRIRTLPESVYGLQTATPHNAGFAVVKLAQKSACECEWQAGNGEAEGSGMWGEFLPLCLNSLQPDDARHATSPCLNFQSVKWEHSRNHASDFSDTGEGQSTVLLQFMAQLCPAHPSTLHGTWL